MRPPCSEYVHYCSLSVLEKDNSWTNRVTLNEWLAAVGRRVSKHGAHRSGQRDDQPVADRHPPVHARGEVQVVGRDERGEPRGAHDGDQRLEDVAGRVRVEVAGRLVGEQQARRVGDRAGDGDPLLLAARQFGRADARAACRGRGRSRSCSRARAPRPCARPRMSCGITTFSSAENSGRRWWNW